MSGFVLAACGGSGGGDVGRPTVPQRPPNQNLPVHGDPAVENKDVTGGSDYWQANTWANCKGYMSDLFEYTSDAFNRLGDVYAASVTSPLMNNALTTLVFNTAEELSGDVSEKLTQDSSCGQTLFNFVNNYLAQSKEIVILNFNYNVDQQNTVKIISEKSNGWEALYTQFLQGNIG